MNCTKVLASCVLCCFFVTPLIAGPCMSSCRGPKQEMSLIELYAIGIVADTRIVVNDIPIIIVRDNGRKWYYVPADPKKPGMWYFVGHNEQDAVDYCCYLRAFLNRTCDVK